MTNKYVEKIKPKDWRTKKEKRNGLLRNLTIAVTVPLIIGSGIALGVNKYFEKQEQEVVDAFAGNCDHRIVNLYTFGGYQAQPNTIARDQFEQLREQFPERFEKISNNEGVSWLIKNYDTKQEEFKIPKYDCE